MPNLIIKRLDDTISEDYENQLLEMIQLVCEPILNEGLYDFASSEMTSRARDAGMEMMLNSRMEEWKTPPPETVFLHRKLLGSYLICARIKARVPVQDLIREHLEGVGG